jgi:hypothetical protein
MSLTPEYGDEELLGGDEEGVQRTPTPLPVDDYDEGEREVQEEERRDRDRVRLEPEDNELRAPGQVCARCGQVITATQDVRRLLDGRYMHEVCPPRPGV